MREHHLDGTMPSFIDKVLGTGTPDAGPGDEPREARCVGCDQVVPAGRSFCDRCQAAGVGGTVVVSPRRAAVVEMGWLAILRSPDLERKGDLIAIDRKVVISRKRRSGPNAASVGGERVLEVDDTYVSAPSMFIYPPTPELGEFSVEANPESTNRATRNDGPLEPGVRTALEDGDVLQVGLTWLCFKRATVT